MVLRRGPSPLVLCGLLTCLVSLTSSVAAAQKPKQCLASLDRAQEERSRGHLLEARRELLVCSAETCPRAVREDCTSWLTQWQRSIPSVVVAAIDRGRDVADATVSLDGAPWLAQLDGTARDVDPGPHELVVERGTIRQTLHFVAREGEQDRRLVVTLREAEAIPPPRIATPLPARHLEMPIASWILGAVGAAAVGSFAVLGFTGKARMDDLRATCSPRCNPDDVAAADRQLLAADLSLVGGLVSLGAAATFFIVRNAASTRSIPRVSSPRASLVDSRWLLRAEF